MKRLALLLCGLALLCPTLPARDAAAAATVQAILISASNRPGGVDPRLAAYAGELRRNLPFTTFRHAGEGTARLSGGRTSLPLSNGHRLELEGGQGGRGGIQLKVQWLQGSRVVMTTTLNLQPGVPAVLGRRGDDDRETPVILIIAN